MGTTFEKGIITITLENGKVTTVNINTGVVIGVSGKEVKGLSPMARRVAKESDNEVVKAYLNGMDALLMDRTINAFPELNGRDVNEVYRFFRGYELNKKTVKVVKDYLEHMDNDFISCYSIERYMNECKRKEILKTISLNEECMEYLTRSASDEIVAMTCKYQKGIKRIIEEEDILAFAKLVYDWNSTHYFFSLVRRYINDCAVIGVKPVWKNFTKVSTVAHKEAEILKEQKESEVLFNYQNSVELHLEDDDFTVIVPTTKEEFRVEAEHQRNCVLSSYYNRVKDCSTHVVFIRKKDDVDTPYITCEVRNNGYIQQYLGRFNERVRNEKAQEFREKYQRYLYSIFE